MDIEHVEKTIVLCGFLIGLIFGFISQRSRFCFLGSIADFYIYKNSSRLSLYLLSLITSIFGVTFLIEFNLLNPKNSLYFTEGLGFFPYSLGGLIFGVGMALCSGCPASSVIKLGEGNLKALMVLFVTGITAIITMRGLFSFLRLKIIELERIFNDYYSNILAFFSTEYDSPMLLRNLILILASVFFLYNLKKNSINKQKIFTGLLIGFCVSSGWYLTGGYGFLIEHPITLDSQYLMTNSGGPESLSFVGPTAYTLELLMYTSDSSKYVSYGIMVVLGTFLGSFVSALFTKNINIDFFRKKNDFINHFVGAIFMGFGGVLASGCSIGNGLTGLSLGSPNSLIAIISIIIGGLIGLRYLENKVT